jgi:uncharacterized metal-binding protein YceD (DUF177 family)
VAPKPSRRTKRAAVVDIEVGEDDDAPEVLPGSLLDVAAPVLEELSLLLDPYPRAPGVTFAAPKDEAEAKESPFAVLAKLKVSSPAKPKRRK